MSEPEQEEAQKIGHSYWGLSDPPRIRSIRGIRIHQLTLPEALSHASKIHPEPNAEGYQLGESSQQGRQSLETSRTLQSHDEDYFHRSRNSENRRSSLEGKLVLGRARSGSASTFVPSSPPVQKIRTTRPRAPTLAGEALEHVLHPEETVQEGEQEEIVEVKQRQLARCFIVLRVPDSQTLNGEKGKTQLEKGKGKEYSSSSHTNGHDQSTKPLLQPIETKLPSARLHTPTTPVRSLSSSDTLIPVHSPKLSRSSTSLHRSRTISSPSSSPSPSSPSLDSPTKPELTRTPSKLGQRPPRLVRSGSEVNNLRKPRPASVIYSPTSLSFQLPSTNSTSQSTSVKQKEVPNPPFFISPVHPPSCFPRFPHLDPKSDFANWLTIHESASHLIDVEVWYEDAEEGWRKVPELGGLKDLRDLRKVDNQNELSENFMLLNLASDPRELYTFTSPEKSGRTTDDGNEGRSARPRGSSVRGIIERSVRETKMKKGTDLGDLHQLINLQAVILDTQRSICDLQRKIGSLLKKDVDRRTLKRDVNERSHEVTWIRSKIGDVNQSITNLQAEIESRQKSLESRRHRLVLAEETEDELRSEAMSLDGQIQMHENDRHDLLPTIHHYRAHHVQSLDSLFPIAPLNPSILLYGILNIPLPIPIGPKDPAPPLTLPATSLPDGIKVDERTTAAALGYVAMVVQILGNLSGNVGGLGGQGGLSYPVTCFGSKSLVKDVTSVMQGPRSFPLYTKGVERYRFDYAVFLLNMNIEMLMQEANMRLVDRRHTLPNLKALLLTLSSPVPPPPRSHSTTVSGSTTYNNSRATSRTVSYQYPYHSPHTQIQKAQTYQRQERYDVFSSPSSSVMGDLTSPRGSVSGQIRSVVGSPLSMKNDVKKDLNRTTGGRRSMLSRTKPMNGTISLNEDRSDVEDQDEDENDQDDMDADGLDDGADDVREQKGGAGKGERMNGSKETVRSPIKKKVVDPEKDDDDMEWEEEGRKVTV